MSREEDAYVIERMGKLLAEIAIIVNGPEPHDTLWSYHDLPEKVRALKQAQQPAALEVPADAKEGRVYNEKQIAWELERTALGDGFYGNALRVAKDLPGVAADDRALLDRFATGMSRSADHVGLQDLALRIYRAPAQQPAAAVPEGYAEAIKAVQEMMPPRDFRPSAQVWLTGNQVNELHARLDAAAMLAAAARKGGES